MKKTDGNAELQTNRPAMDEGAEVQAALTDTRMRALRDLRISLTDRCNFRCTYCMPREVFGQDYAFLDADAVLTFEEIIRLAKVFAVLGVRKIRLTGGEPMLRPGIEGLIGALREIPQIEDIALTTNGSMLTKERAMRLRAAGLNRITVSLDSLDDALFRAMNDVGFPVRKVTAGIQAAVDAGLSPVKVNMVVKKGVNDSQILPMAEYFRGTDCILRFIEFMDVGNTNHWKLGEVVPAKDIIHTIHERWALEPVTGHYAGEVAKRYRYADGQGEIGVISSVTQAFCGGCTRARLSAEGALFTCLFGEKGFSLRDLVRQGATDEEIADTIRDIWHRRDDRYSEIRSTDQVSRKKVEMSHIGG